MPSCVVQGCNSGSRTRSPDIILHVFPKDINRIRLWLMQTKQQFTDLDEFARIIYESKNHDTYRMCSKHFTNDAYSFDPNKKSLRKNALPTIFNDDITPSTLDTSEIIANNFSQTGLQCPNCGHTLDVSRTPLPSEQRNEAGKQKRNAACQTGHKHFMRTKFTQTRVSKSTVKVQCNRLRPKRKKAAQHLHSSAKKNKKIQSADDVPDKNLACQETFDTFQIAPVNVSMDDHMELDLPEIPVSPIHSSTPKYSVVSSQESSITSLDEGDPTFTISDITGSTTESDSDEDDQENEELLSEHFNEIEQATKCNSVRENKFLVFESCLDKLIQQIKCNCKGNCGQPFKKVQKKRVGTYVSVYVECVSGHYFRLWESQPKIGRKPLGNLILSSAVLTSGSTYAKINQFFFLAGIIFMSHTTFYKYQKKYLFPTIEHVWKKEQEKFFQTIDQPAISVAGDGQCDSPGHNAKYCCYTLLEVNTNKILNFNIQQIGSGVSSVSLEKSACKNALDDLISRNINLGIICTDRHVAIRKMIKEEYPNICHEFDVWHMAKNIGKKIVSASHKKKCDQLSDWVGAIKNHMWWSASTCNNDPELLKQKWNSILYHVVNVHSWEDPQSNYQKCQHDSLSKDVELRRMWLKKKSQPYEELKKVVLNPRLQKDLAHLSNFCNTGSLEVYHSALLKYRTKRQHFFIDGMYARTQLAAMDHNFNSEKIQALVKRCKTEEERIGMPRFSFAYSKAKKDWYVRAIYEPSNQTFLIDLIEEAVEFAAGNRSFEWLTQKEAFSKNIAPFERPCKKQLIESHHSRFPVQ